jgi:DNA-binding response OmpR family regulator
MATVLLIDDDPDIRFLHEVVLKGAGYQIETADSGTSALAVLRGGVRPDVVVLDIQMPDVDGWDVLSAVRGDASLRDIPVVLCSVKTGIEDRERGWRMGCDGYLLKPFDIHELERLVADVLTRTPAERERVRNASLTEALAQKELE